MQVWALDTAELLHSLRGHLGEITDLAVSPNNVLLASSDTNHTVRVWALATGAPVAVLKHGTEMNALLRWCVRQASTSAFSAQCSRVEACNM